MTHSSRVANQVEMIDLVLEEQSKMIDNEIKFEKHDESSRKKAKQDKAEVKKKEKRKKKEEEKPKKKKVKAT